MDTQLIETARAKLGTIPDDARREMIAKSRWTCDSHWMMSMVMHAGWEVANKINLQVAQAVGSVEMHRLMKALGLQQPRNRDEFIMMVTLAMETFVTKDYMDYWYETPEHSAGLGVVQQCYANTKLRSIGAQKDYQCGCFGLRSGWYHAMGVEVREKLLKCLKDGDERCEILVENVAFPS
ncbi:MAG: hypothetical protein C4519_27830 [Desulfobacteraceae bacterium]|nr:MAG: hypothetical protein C4519_27830 [Desulfobacteraceae bacterium]